MPILYIIALPYIFKIGNPVYLIFIQNLAVSSSIYLLGKSLQDIFKIDRIISVFFCILYMLSPGLQNSVIFDFHPENLLPPLFLLLLYSIEKQRLLMRMILIVFLLSIKEHVGLTLTALGLVVWTHPTSKKIGKQLVLIGVVSIVGMMILGSEIGFLESVSSRYCWLGNSNIERFHCLFSDPMKVISGSLVKNDGYLYVLRLLAPTLFFGLLKPQWLLPALPSFLLNLFCGFSASYLFSFHYQIDMEFWIIIASAIAWQTAIHARPERSRYLKPISIGLMLILSLADTVLNGNLFLFSRHFTKDIIRIENLEMGRNLRSFAEKNFTEDTRFAVTGSIIFPEFLHQNGYSLFTGISEDYEYIAIDKKRLHWKENIKKDISSSIEAMKKSDRWTAVYEDPRFLIFSSNGFSRHSMQVHGKSGIQ